MENKRTRIIRIRNKEITVTYNSELDKYKDVVLFPEKVAKANESIAKYGLPEQYYRDQEKKK